MAKRPRLDEETRIQTRREYMREYMRRYRAAHPDVILRQRVTQAKRLIERYNASSTHGTKGGDSDD